MKKHNDIRVPAFVLIALLLLTGCGSTSSADTPIPAATPSGSGSAILAEGRIVPRDFTNLYVGAPGKVEEVLVAEGETVTEGTILLRLGDREAYEANLAAAQTDVTAAQQALDQLKRTADLAYNQALLDEATAQKAYNTALKAWDDFDQDQYEKDLDKAKSDVATALSELKDAQTEFDKYADREKDNPDRVRTKRALDDAQSKYDNAVIRQTEIENKYIQVKSNLEVARGRLAEATRIRKQRENGPDADQLALAQSNLDAAQARRAAAQAALDQRNVVAPYDGVVARIDISAGENALPSLPVIVFADLKHWYVETTDFTEKEVVNIKVGQLVTVVPDALPNLTLTGTVERIGLTFMEKVGDIVYPVRIRLDPSDATLFWGMTAEVRIKE
ncbi:MAG: HlyD family efflux transporter periplasmic adaptor subunit [Anaerolineales bacterium]